MADNNNQNGGEQQGFVTEAVLDQKLNAFLEAIKGQQGGGQGQQQQQQNNNGQGEQKKSTLTEVEKMALANQKNEDDKKKMAKNIEKNLQFLNSIKEFNNDDCKQVLGEDVINVMNVANGLAYSDNNAKVRGVKTEMFNAFFKKEVNQKAVPTVWKNEVKQFMDLATDEKPKNVNRVWSIFTSVLETQLQIRKAQMARGNNMGGTTNKTTEDQKRFEQEEKLFKKRFGLKEDN